MDPRKAAVKNLINEFLSELNKPVKGAQKVLPAAERAANLEAFLSKSQVREPLYHATPKDIKAFKPGGDDPTMSGRAIWTTTSKTNQPAQHNIGSRKAEFREGVNVMPLHGRAERPLMLDDPVMVDWAQSVFAGGSKEFPELLPDQWLNEVKDAGYDSVILADPHGRGDPHEVIFFEPTQLKSALGNQGTYDINDPDINKATGGEVHAAGGGLKQAVKGKIDNFLAELNKPAKAAPQDEALRLAQQRAALPPSQGGLGLPANNTPEQRAKAMSWNTHGFHATNADIKKFDPNLYGASDYGSIGQGVYIDPSKSAGYANLVASIVGKDKPANVMPLLVREGNVFNADQLPLITNAKTSKEVSKNLKKLGYDSVMSEVNGQPNEMVVFDPDRVRSRFAAFDPFRRDVATAALFGVAAPDLLAQEQEKAAGGDVHMADGGDPMLADIMERFNTPRNKSRYSAGIFDSNAPGEVRSVTPTVKERMASGLQSAMERAGSDRYKARQRAQTIVGGENSRLPLGYGVLDIGAMVNPTVAAAMIPVYAESAMHDLANVPNALKRGDIIGAGVETGFGLMDLIPAIGQGKRVAKGVAQGIKNAVTSDAGYDLAQRVLNATGTAPIQIMKGSNATSVDDFIKKLYGNKPTGEVNYVTAQEGPFYRVSPSGAGEGQASRTGVREVTGTGEGTGSGGTGAVRGKVAKRYSPEEVARLVRENNIARRAAEKFGGTQTESLLTTMPPTSLAKQGAIGRAFMEASTDNPQYKQAVYEAYGRQMPKLMETIGARDYDDLMNKAYRQLNYETAQQFNQMPVNMSFHRAGEGDYRSSGEMLEDVHGNQHLYVFQGGEPHNMMSDVDPRTGLNQTEQFRAVHDLFGHAVHGNEFGPKGEELAFGAHSQMYSPLARIALATETRGQNSVVNYTPLNVELKAELAKLDALRYEAMRRGDEGLANEIAQQKRALYGENFQYSPNRGLLLPPEFTDPMYEGGLPEYMSGIFRPSQGTSERLTHFSHDPSLTMTDPSRYGTGIRGEELYRLQGSKAPVMGRTYFYRGDDPRPEAGLGRYRYGTQGEDLYSMASDPERLGLLAREANRMPFTARSNQGLINEDQALTDFERLAKEYGYEGLLGDRAAIMYNPAAVERYAHGGEVHMAAGGDFAKKRAKEAIKSGAEAIDDFLNFLKTRGSERLSPNYTNQALSDQQQRMAEQIAQANPRLAAENVQKKALQQAQKKLEWERTEKPGLVKSYGALTPASYSESILKRKRNTPDVVQKRIDEANRFLDQPTEAWTPPPPELQAFDRSLIKDALTGFPGVQQSTFPRDIPSRSSTSYVDELYEDPQNRALIKKQIMRGLPLGGETFYASLYPVKVATLEAGMAPDAFDKWVHAMAPASARNSIMNEMAVGQFLRNLHAKGIPLTEANVKRAMEDFKNTYGMGLPLMPVHREGVADVLEGGRNLRDMSLANIPTNYKIPTYGTQKAGDFAGSVVLDTHEAAGETLGSRYHPYFSEQGGFSNAEYHPGEQGMLGIARELGNIPGGMAQAGRWFGGGELTGLISPRGDALDLLEKQMAYTLHNQGRQPNPANIRKETLDQIRSLEGVLLPWWMRGGMPDYRTTGLQRKEGGDVSLDDFLANLESTH